MTNDLKQSKGPEVLGSDTELDSLGVELSMPCSASILVVDDNPLIVDVLRGLLRAQNYRVFSSKNGKEAAELLSTKKVDVIICDVMMPRMGGYEFYEFVRQTPECSHIPFIFLTSLDDRGDIDRGKEIGADDYVCKPFEPRELLAIVKGKIARGNSIKEMGEKRYDNYRRKVIHTLSHEFRTPLVAINTGMELLIEQGDSLESIKAKNLFEAVRRGGLRLEKLVNDFMILQQIEAGVPRRVYEARASKKQASVLVNGYLRSKGANYIDQGSKITFTDDSDGAMVTVVENQIQDCIDRLVSNAVKFSASNREIELHLYTIDGEVYLDVKDRGIGINMDKLDEAIDVFGQINRERLEQQGGGLGLPIANQYAVINKGRLEFEPRKDGGSVVSLVLPIAKEGV